MAETGFNPAAFTVAATSETRDALADRPRASTTRVQPLEESDSASTSNSSDTKSTEERIAEIERLAVEGLKNSRLSISRDDSSGEFIYEMVDQDTGEAVRRWPPEKHSDLVNYLRSRTAGLVDRLA